MSPCRHIQSDTTCALGRRPLDCACRFYDGSPNMPANLVAEWDRLMADRISVRRRAIYALTELALVWVAIMATIGVTAMLL